MPDLSEQESEFARRIGDAPFDDAPRPVHRDALRDQALARFEAAASGALESYDDSLPENAPGHHEAPPKFLMPAWKRAFAQGRKIMRRPIPRLIAFTVCSLLIGGVWMFLPGHQSTAEAFNRYAAAIVAAKTARYQMEVHVEGLPKQTAKAYYLAPGRTRLEIGSIVNIGDLRTGKMIILSPAQKTAMQMVLKGKPDDQQTRHNFERLRELLAESRDGKESEYVKIGEKELDGKRAVGFRYDSPVATITLWGDPATGVPVRIETIWSGVPRTEVTMFDFEADVMLDEKLFDMTPPADYKEQSFDVDASKPGEADLVSAFRACSDIGDGKFPEAMDTASVQKIIIKYATRPDRKEKTLTDEDTRALMKHSVSIGRGFQFTLELPESADAHYAGKGVERDTKDRPVFWYKPEGKTKYRVIFADLTVKDADTAPTVEGARRIEKASKGAKPAAEK